MLDLLMFVVLSYLDPAIFDEKNTSIEKKIHRFNISQIWTLLNRCIFFSIDVFFWRKGREFGEAKIHRPNTSIYTSILRPGNGSQCEHPSGVCAKVLQQFLIRPPCFDVRWNNVPSFWHSSIVGIQEGSAFCRSSKCGFTGPIKKVAEWNICWRPVARDISAG